MFPGVLALLERSLRVDARAMGAHLLRLGLMATIYLAVINATVTGTFFGAPGLRFFTSIFALNLTFVSLLGIGAFSTVITEEKEEDTLGLMTMAGISPLGILLGKSIGRLIQALLLIAVQYPFTLLAVTMGGVEAGQIRAAYLALMAYTIMLAGLGALCSTVAPRNRAASLWLFLLIGLYYSVPAFLNWCRANHVVTSTFITRILGWVSDSCVFIEFDEILTTGFNAPMLSHQVISNTTIGLFGFLMSWVLFGFAESSPSTERTARGMLAVSSQTLPLFAPGDPWVNPDSWKDFYFVGGGFAAVIMRFAFYIALYCVGPYVEEHFLGFGRNTDTEFTGAFMTLTMIAMSIDAAILVSQSLHEEVRGQTLATLTLLPISTGKILYSKIAGVLRVWLPGPAFLLFAAVALPGGQECTADFFQANHAAPWLVIAFLLLVPHSAAVAALYVRWGGALVGIGVAIGVMVLVGTVISTLQLGPSDAGSFFAAWVLFGISALSHLVVWLRATALSER